MLVPSEVAIEIQRRGPRDVTAIALRDEPFLEIVSPPQVPDIISQWGLGSGESSVLAIAYANMGVTAIIDDRLGRKCATSLGIAVRGTLGLVLAAKRRGFISSATAVVQDLLDNGLYLSGPVLSEALKLVDE